MRQIGFHIGPPGWESILGLLKRFTNTDSELRQGLFRGGERLVHSSRNLAHTSPDQQASGSQIASHYNLLLNFTAS